MTSNISKPPPEPFYQDELDVLKEIKRILWRHLDRKMYKAFVYGSRATGDYFKWSDIDVGVEGKREIPSTTYFDIEEELEESDIPYVLELVDFCKVKPDFKKRAMEKIIPLN